MADRRPRGLRDLDELDAVFSALSHNTRRHILQVLHTRKGSMTAGELAACFSHSWPTTTRHLGVLVQAGLITVRPDGRERHYVLNRERLTAALDLWLPSVGLGSYRQPRPDPS
ncbi:MAG: helix-turn-helix transcriptional regulator [Geodermatophilaceae bacterium]|nr:helix-turn-helix transcriptional regulator [Geodermatophilaceae bacterium]MDQ3476979.1 metalloregulator ArsR/SmtB family transcription factor [Actinomycetota bacterium]